MDWNTLYCPNRACRYYGKPFPHSQLVKNGATRGQKQALCRACGRSVTITYGTAYFELESDPTVFDTAVRALAEGVSLRSTARIFQIDKDRTYAVELMSANLRAEPFFMTPLFGASQGQF